MMGFGRRKKSLFFSQWSPSFTKRCDSRGESPHTRPCNPPSIHTPVVAHTPHTGTYTYADVYTTPPPFSSPSRSRFFFSRWARTGTYIDKKCPFTGNVSIRGRILTGTVKSTKMKRTIIMRMNYLHYIKKYQRYEKRHTNIAAHISPCFRCAEGDTVIVGQCRPLSKTVRFNTLKVIPSGAKAGKSFAAH